MDGADRSEPYTESGAHAAALTRSSRAAESYSVSLQDADEAEARGHSVGQRSRRNTRFGIVAFALTLILAAWLGVMAVTSHDGTYDGAVAGNWSMLGLVLALGALNFIWGWISAQRRLRETSARLVRRAAYQRALAASQLAKAEHETVR